MLAWDLLADNDLLMGVAVLHGCFCCTNSVRNFTLFVQQQGTPD